MAGLPFGRLGLQLARCFSDLDHFRWDPVQYGLIFSVLQS
jgi:hypothetical protein